MIKLELTRHELFTQGQEPSLSMVLDHRDKRAAFQERLIHQHIDEVLICLKCNIPGTIKNNAGIEAVLKSGIDQIVSKCKDNNWPITFTQMISEVAGCDYFALIDTRDTYLVKQAMIAIEDGTPLGRLYDIDVFSAACPPLTRQILGYKERRCFICANPAKVCGSVRNHGLAELHEAIIRILEEGSVIFSD